MRIRGIEPRNRVHSLNLISLEKVEDLYPLIEYGILMWKVKEETNDVAAEGREDEERTNEHKLHSTSASRSKQGKQNRKGVRPLLDEVTMLNSAAGNNP
ncbi:hypothetical protein V6N12_017867 [Hibiscus sabdariffa]|uniref:Uncharacterized protein n=1 Tax=Hibiscus sabdariffa TaxID=183260 RepID=A0ABR2AKL2_9ROSI